MSLSIQAYVVPYGLTSHSETIHSQGLISDSISRFAADRTVSSLLQGGRINLGQSHRRTRFGVVVSGSKIGGNAIVLAHCSAAHRLDSVETRMGGYLPESHGQTSGQTEKGCEK